MADNDQYNDEYQFADLDMVSTEPEDESSEYVSGTPPESNKGFFASNNIRRNVLIVIVMVILAIVVYKLLSSFFAGKKVPTKPAVSQVAPAPRPQPIAQEEPRPSVLPVQPLPAESSDSSLINQKLSALEISQESLRANVNSVNNQLGGISSNVNEMATQIAHLNQILSSLSAKLDEQSREVDKLIVRTKPKVRKAVAHKPVAVKKYFIQAIIPGRAWLISTNGTTLTVREGSNIPGYGTIKLIDPHQGRVLTSSGQIIKFSQEDS